MPRTVTNQTNESRKVAWPHPVRGCLRLLAPAARGRLLSGAGSTGCFGAPRDLVGCGVRTEV